MAGSLPEARGVVATLALGALVLAAPNGLYAQEEVEAVLSGRLDVSGQPADTGTVVLHRVTPEDAGELDTTRVAPDGSFSFTLPNLPVPGSGEVFFVSTRHDGVLYAGDPLSDPIQLDSVQVLDAYPTEPVPPEGVALPITRREIWVNEGPMGWEVTDVLEIRNAGSTTLVPEEGGTGAVWSYPLPPGARSPRMVQMGPSTGDSRFENGMLVARNPVLPGENYYVVQYDLESLESDLPLPGSSGLVQLLMRDTAPAVQVTGLARQPDEEIEVGNTFRRWAGENLSDQTVTIRLGEETGSNAVVWLSVTLAILLAGIGGWLVQRRAVPARISRGGIPPVPAGTRTDAGGRARLRRDVLVDLARLDEAYAQMDEPDEAEVERYRRRRAELIAELQAGETRGADPADR